jgi:hypothetical protein
MLAIAAVTLLVLPGYISAQSGARLKPLPPKKVRPAAAEARPFAAAALLSSWQTLPNQPPVLDYFDCGPGSPLLLTDGTFIMTDNDYQDWWKFTNEELGNYVNRT